MSGGDGERNIYKKAEKERERQGEKADRREEVIEDEDTKRMR